MEVTLSARRYLRVFLAIAVVLTLISFAARTVNVLALKGHLHRPIILVDVDEEKSVPTWFSSADLAVTSALVVGICLTLKQRGDRKYRFHWWLLAIGFLILSVDEAIAFHELTGAVVKKVIPNHGALRFVWIAWGGVLVVGLAIFYARFVLSLAARRRRQFIVAGALFVFAAVGMEVIGGKVMEKYNSRDAMPYIAEAHVEEFLEMYAIILFNAALIEHLGELTGTEGITVRCKADVTDRELASSGTSAEARG